MTKTYSAIRHFFSEHLLSVVSTSILVLWIVLYTQSRPTTHTGSFFGNAIADWLGVVIMVFTTKYLYEKGLSERAHAPKNFLSPILRHVRNHSLSIFLLLSGIGWVVLYATMDSESKWGQVVGNIVSQWTQVLSLVFLTRRHLRRHAKVCKGVSKPGAAK